MKGPPPDELPQEVIPPYAANPIVDAARGLTADSNRALGGLASGKLITAVLELAHQDKQEAKDELKAVYRCVDKLRDEVSRLERENSVLIEINFQWKKLTHVRNFLNTAGVVIAGFGIDEIAGEISGLAVALIVVGIVMLGFAWFWKTERSSNDS